MSENKPDRKIFQCYLVGSYVYSIYKKNTGGIKINGDKDSFYFILGWHIQQSYPQVYNSISNNLIP